MREAVADQVRAPLLVRHAAAEELGAHLDHHVELAHVQGRLLPEPDLYVARLDRAGHRFLSAFDRLADNARAMGFGYVAAGPLVRSSYRAGELYVEKRLVPWSKEISA